MVFTSYEIIKILEADGWKMVRTKGSHHIYQHESKKGNVVISHPRDCVKKGTANMIFKQAGLNMRGKK